MVKKRYKSIFYSLTLFFLLSIFIFENIGYGINCRGQNPIKKDDLEHKGHFYTCEYNNIETKERMKNYCARDNTTSTRPTYDGCPITIGDKLICHICECTLPKQFDSMGRCCEEGNIVNGICCPKGTFGTDEGICCPEGQLPNENLECVDQTTTSDPPGGGDQTGGGSDGNNEENQDNPTQVCPNEQLDSRGNCCKKRYYDVQKEKMMCCEGILLSTNVPFIGQCIVYRKAGEPQPAAGLVVDESSAFPVLMGGLSRIMVSAILLSGFIGILIGGVMISASGATEEGASKGRKIIGNIISALALLGASGVILRLINPSFFG